MSSLRTERSSVAATWILESKFMRHQGTSSAIKLALRLMGASLLVAAGLGGIVRSADIVMPPDEPQKERHLRNIRQLTEGRQNAEAYFSFDGASLIFQSTRDGRDCYQEYVMALESGAVRLVSTGQGGTTCGYFLPGDRRVLFSSTHLKSPLCPAKPSAQGLKPEKRGSSKLG